MKTRKASFRVGSLFPVPGSFVQAHFWIIKNASSWFERQINQSEDISELLETEKENASSLKTSPARDYLVINVWKPKGAGALKMFWRKISRVLKRFIFQADNEANESLMGAINADGRIHLVPSTTHGTFFLRFATCTPNTTVDDVHFAFNVSFLKSFKRARDYSVNWSFKRKKPWRKSKFLKQYFGSHRITNCLQDFLRFFSIFLYLLSFKWALCLRIQAWEPISYRKS